MASASGSIPKMAASEVINTGRKRRLTGTQKRFAQIVSRREMIFHRVEHQDAVLGDDADRHNHAHE
ncbi:MAG: hypothetical protein WKF84_00665 [Pyrinomonadaceae bacterium]